MSGGAEVVGTVVQGLVKSAVTEEKLRCTLALAEGIKKIDGKPHFPYTLRILQEVLDQIVHGGGGDGRKESGTPEAVLQGNEDADQRSQEKVEEDQPERETPDPN